MREDHQNHLKSNPYDIMVKPNTNSRSGFYTRTLKALLTRNASMKRRISAQNKREKQMMDAISHLEKNVEESRIEFETFRKKMAVELSDLKKKLENKSESSSSERSNEKSKNTDSNRINENKKNIEQLDLRLQLHENTTYNGRILWKIDHFRTRQKQAKAGKTNGLHSAPSFTSEQNGYKFCLRIYPDGDGVGKGTHLSLFIVIMKSDYDQLLTWPFNKQVKFVLINQKDRAKDLQEVMTPDTLSVSFQRPVGEMNIASGCALFVSLDRLEEDGFVEDDTMFIDVNIEE